MSFLQPTFLWALGLLAIPVIIHLFNFRRYQKVVFSNVDMLKEIQTESRKTRQVKKWLVLATRMLALIALVFAFAQPYLPQENAKDGRQLVSVYLDNSESMRAEGEDGQLFENGKNTARQILQNLPKDAEVQVLDNALSPFSNRLYSPDKAIKLIDDLEVDYRPNDLAKVIQKINNKYVSEGFASQYSFVISDFQQNSTSEVLLDSGLVLNLFPMKPEALQNLSVDSVWLEEPVSRPNTPVKLKVKVVNNGAESVESSTVVLKVNGVQQGVESFGVAAKSEQILDLGFTSTQKGWITGEISLSDVPVVFDNVYHLALNIKPSINVLQIGAQSREVAKIFGKDLVFSLTNTAAGSIDYAGLSKYDFIILNALPEVSSGLAEQLKIFANKGGVVAVLPSATGVNYSSLSTTLGAATYGSVSTKDLSITPKDLKHPFIKDVYKKVPDNVLLPKVKKLYQLKGSGSSQRILSLKDGADVLTRTRVGAGSVFQFGVPLGSDFSNLADHELFVLVMLKMAFSKSNKQKLAYPLFMQESISLDEGVNGAILSLAKGERQILVESGTAARDVRFWLNNEIDEAGVYSLQNETKQELAKVALNYSRAESKQRFATETQLREQLSGATVNMINGSTAAIKSATDRLKSGTPLWKVFIGLCLLFLLIEILLLRYLKS